MSKPPYHLSVSIVLFNTGKSEIVSLLTILRRADLRLKVYLIDNSPVPSDYREYEEEGLVEYHFAGRNLGFGAGHNLAVSRAEVNSEFHLILNSDIVFDPGILKEIYGYMKSNEQIGMLGPRVYNPDGSIQFSAKLLPTPSTLLLRRFVLRNKRKSKKDDQYELRNFELDRICRVPFLLGCFLFVRTRSFKEVGGFDERFFMYMEDVDLTRRVGQNYETVYYPLVSIVHDHGRGSYTSKRLLQYHVVSAIRYFNKWGWFLDKERKQVNKRTIEQFG